VLVLQEALAHALAAGIKRMQLDGPAHVMTTSQGPRTLGMHATELR